jgi:hypothetical protein
MSQDIRRMSREDLDKLNREIARYKAARGGQPATEAREEIADPQPIKVQAQQLELL